MSKRSRIKSLIIFVLISAPFIYLYFNSIHWRYAELIKKMKAVPFGDAIVSINVSTYHTTLFDVEIRPNTVSKKEAYSLGISLTELLDNELVAEPERGDRLNGLIWEVGVTIHPIPDQGDRLRGYSFTRRRDYQKLTDTWYFLGAVCGEAQQIQKVLSTRNIDAENIIYPKP